LSSVTELIEERLPALSTAWTLYVFEQESHVFKRRRFRRSRRPVPAAWASDGVLPRRVF
jgi:hypothetical protein